jgi:hypothetical protein
MSIRDQEIPRSPALPERKKNMAALVHVFPFKTNN